MKKLLTLLLSAMMLFGTASCTALADFIQNASNKMGAEQTATFTVQYDYGFHVEGEAVALLDGNNVFFDAEAYGVAPLLAGDKVTVRYTGEMLIQETYPGTVVLQGGEIVEITKESAPIVALTYKDNTCWLGEERVEALLPEYVVSQDLTFQPLPSLGENTTFFATQKSYDQAQKTFVAYAVYDYNPR